MPLNCPNCCKMSAVIKSGYYVRKSDSQTIQRYQCIDCGKSFSQASFSPCYRQNKRRLNIHIRNSLCSQVSIRRSAKLLHTTKKTVQRKLKFLAQQAELNQQKWLEHKSFKHVQFDDLETFEHTKAKPITVCMAVEYKTRKIIDFCVAPISAKGHLSKISRKKYGIRKDLSRIQRAALFTRLQQVVDKKAQFNSDQNPQYINLIKKHFPKSEYISCKGVRGCITGQGELKKLAFDPLFSINHTFAMLRANINRLIRKTWCTTKNIHSLYHHIALYVDFHNQVLT